MLPVRVRETQLPGFDALVLEDVHHRMGFGHEEDPVRCDVPRDHVRPGPDVGQPVERSPRGIDDVEHAVEVGRQRVQVRQDEAGLGVAELVGEPCGELDRRGRDVGAGNDRAEPRPRQGVDPEVALQVEQRLAGDITDQLDLVGSKAHAARPECREVVEVARGVDRRPGIPKRSIGFEGGGQPIRSATHRSDQANNTSG